MIGSFESYDYLCPEGTCHIEEDQKVFFLWGGGGGVVYFSVNLYTVLCCYCFCDDIVYELALRLTMKNCEINALSVHMLLIEFFSHLIRLIRLTFIRSKLTSDVFQPTATALNLLSCSRSQQCSCNLFYDFVIPHRCISLQIFNLFSVFLSLFYCCWYSILC